MTKKLIAIASIALSLIAFQKCNAPEATSANDSAPEQLPNYFPALTLDSLNQSAQVIELGRLLFHDPILSVDSTLACVSCHNQQLAFADSIPISFGVDSALGFRNSPTLANMAFHPIFMLDGGVPTLELQAFAPVHAEFEMNYNLALIEQRLQQHNYYSSRIQTLFPKNTAAFAITRSLAAFQRTLLSYQSNYDAYLQGDSAALTIEAKRGLALFQSEKLGCTNCHSGFNFTNFGFEHNGFYSVGPDSGRARITEQTADVGKFKVPTLRNIARTAPYFHNGELATLTEVLNHYASGGNKHPNKSQHIKGFALCETEKSDLLAFFNALTDSTFCGLK